MRKRTNIEVTPPPGLDWTETEKELPNEKELVLTRNKSLWSGFTEPILLRRKGEHFFFPDWSQRVYSQPEFWKYL